MKENCEKSEANQPTETSNHWTFHNSRTLSIYADIIEQTIKYLMNNSTLATLDHYRNGQLHGKSEQTIKYLMNKPTLATLESLPKMANYTGNPNKR
jgi:hypothetical protein